MRAVQTAIPMVLWPTGVLIAVGCFVACFPPKPANVHERALPEREHRVVPDRPSAPTAPVAPRHSHRDEEVQLKLHGSKADGTFRKLEWYAREAYQIWSREHPGKECPETLDELNVYIGVSDSLDLWGHPIWMECGPTNPPGLRGFNAMSVGEDGIRGTSDDFEPF